MLPLVANADMERAVLGACLKDIAAFAHTKNKVYTDEVFTDPKNRAIWKSINRVFTRDGCIDYHLLYDDLLNNGELADMGGAAYIATVLCSVSTSAYIEYHVYRLLQAHASRGLIVETANGLESMKQDVAGIPVIASDLSESLDKLILQSGTDAGMVNFDKVQDKVFESISEQDALSLKGLSTGIAGLDQAFGILPGLYLLAGPKGHLKSATALSIARHRINVNNEIVLWFGYEMPKEQTYMRLISMDSGVANNVMLQRRLQGFERARIMQTAQSGRLNNLIHSSRSFEIDELCRHVIHQKVTHGDRLRIVVIDYLQLIPVKDVKRYDTAARAGALREAQGQLKQLCNDYGLNIWLLAGVSSDWVKYEWPDDSLLAECKSAHDPDVMLWMWNKQDEPGHYGFVDMIVTKNRYGSDNIAIPLKYTKPIMLVEDDGGRECKPREVSTGAKNHGGNYKGSNKIRSQKPEYNIEDNPF